MVLDVILVCEQTGEVEHVGGEALHLDGKLLGTLMGGSRATVKEIEFGEKEEEEEEKKERRGGGNGNNRKHHFFVCHLATCDGDGRQA